MNIYLICNNMLSENICYDKEMDIEEKKLVRPLSVEGTKLTSKIDIGNVPNIYSSSYFSAIECAKFIADKGAVDVIINNNLNDCLIGDLKKQSLKMLSYFQEHDFNYKLSGGESLNDCANRISAEIEKIKKIGEDAAVVLPRRALFSYLAMFSSHGFNLDDRLVLTRDEDIIMDSSEDKIEIFKIFWTSDEINIMKLTLGD